MSEKFKTETYEVNFHQSKKLYNLAKKNNVKKFIFASSCSLYGFANKSLKNEKCACNPLTNYSKTKFLFEKFLNKKEDNVEKVILRFGTAAGVSNNFRLNLAINNLIYSGIKNNMRSRSTRITSRYAISLRGGAPSYWASFDRI